MSDAQQNPGQKMPDPDGLRLKCVGPLVRTTRTVRRVVPSWRTFQGTARLTGNNEIGCQLTGRCGGIWPISPTMYRAAEKWFYVF